MSGSWGVGPAAFEQVQQWAYAVWPYAIAILAFCAGYVVGGIVQRG